MMLGFALGVGAGLVLATLTTAWNLKGVARAALARAAAAMRADLPRDETPEEWDARQW